MKNVDRINLEQELLSVKLARGKEGDKQVDEEGPDDLRRGRSR